MKRTTGLLLKMKVVDVVFVQCFHVPWSLSAATSTLNLMDFGMRICLRFPGKDEAAYPAQIEMNLKWLLHL